MTFRTSVVYNGTGQNLTLTKPTGMVIGDLMVMFMVTTTATCSVTDWAGHTDAAWVMFTQFATTGPSVRHITVYTRHVGETAFEAATYTPTLSASDTYSIIIGVWAGRMIKYPEFTVNNINNTGNATPITATATGFTVPVGADIAVFKALAKSVGTDVWTTTATGGMTARQNVNSGVHTVGLDAVDGYVGGDTGGMASTATRTSGTGTAGWVEFSFYLEAYASTPASVHVGMTQFGNDYFLTPMPPTNNMLFCCWHKNDGGVGDYPRDFTTYGDMVYFQLFGPYTQFQGLGGNLNVPTSTTAAINENTSLFFDLAGTGNATSGTYNYAGDFTYWQSPNTYNESVALAWTWSAWQVQLNASDITMRQWSLVSPYTTFQYFETILTYTQIRAITLDGGATHPFSAMSTIGTTFTQLQLGNGGFGNMAYVRLYSGMTGAKPADATMLAIAKNFAADTTAWADWPLQWTGSGTSYLNDVSGHGRNLTTTGTILEGQGGIPSFGTVYPVSLTESGSAGDNPVGNWLTTAARVEAATSADNPASFYTAVGAVAEASGRTNMVYYSRDLTQYTPSGLTVVSNAIGDMYTGLADKLVETVGTVQHFAQATANKAAMVLPMTASVFVKAGERTTADIGAHDGTGIGYYCQLNLNTGVLTGPTQWGAGANTPTAGVIAYPNGWYRVWIACYTNAAIYWCLRVCPNDGLSGFDGAYAGDVTKGMYFWGTQIEYGLTATDPIATSGSPVTVYATDASSSIAQFPVVRTEGATGADTPSAVQLIAAGLGEAGTAGDLPSTTYLAVSGINEPGTAVDSPTLTMQAPVSVTESGTAIDGLTTSMQAISTLTEAGTAVDNPTSVAAFVAARVEPATAADTPTNILATSGSLNEPATAVDVPTGGTAYVSGIVESGTGGDSPAAVQLIAAAASEMSGRTQLLPYSLFQGANGVNFGQWGWANTGNDGGLNATLISSQSVLGVTTQVVQVRLTASGGYQGFQISSMTMVVGITYYVSMAIRIPTGVTSSGAVLYFGSSLPGTIQIASAAALNAQAKDTWVMYYTPIVFTDLTNNIFSIITPGGSTGQGFDVALPQVERYGYSPFMPNTTGAPIMAPAVETVSSVAALASSTSESSTAGDSPSTVQVAGVAIAEAGTAVDAPTTSMQAIVARVEPAAAADAPVGYWTTVLSQSEPVSAGDGVDSTSSGYNSIAEAGNALAVQSTAWATTATTAEAGAAADTPYNVLTMVIGTVEAAAAGDSPQGAQTQPVSQSEVGTAADSQSNTNATTTAITEAGTAGSTTAMNWATTASQSDSGTAVDTVASGATVVVSQVDSGAAGDGPSAVQTVVASQSDAGAAGDQPSTTWAATTGISEAGTAGDSVSNTLTMVVSTGESTAAADSSVGSAQWLIGLVEAATATDYSLQGMNWFIGTLEASAAADSASVLAASVLAINESGVAADVVSSLQTFSLMLNEAGLADSAHAVYIQALVNTLEPSVALDTATGITTLKYAGVSESGTAIVQSSAQYGVTMVEVAYALDIVSSGAQYAVPGIAVFMANVPLVVFTAPSTVFAFVK